MVTINVKDIVSNYSDNESGLVLLETIKNYLNSGQSVAVSFDSVSYVSTSFVNSAFINLLQDYSFNEIKKSEIAKLGFTIMTGGGPGKARRRTEAPG